MKKYRENLAKLAILKSEEYIVPLPMNFFKDSFTLAVFDSFDHNDKSTTSGTSTIHDKKSPLIKMIKPTKSETSSETVNMEVKLQCQEIIPYSTGKQISLPETFIAASDQLNMTTKDREGYEKQEFIINCVRNIQTKSSIPTWARCKTLLSKQQVSTMQVGFIPFIPSPVTDQSTVYTAMKNFNIVLKQLEQNSLPSQLLIHHF